MPQTERVRLRLQALDERLARLRTERDRLAARASRTERRRDTRRKIVIDCWQVVRDATYSVPLAHIPELV